MARLWVLVSSSILLLLSSIRFLPRDAMLARYMLSSCVCPFIKWRYICPVILNDPDYPKPPYFRYFVSHFVVVKGKKKKSIYIAPFIYYVLSQSAQAWITQFYLQIHHACLSFVSVHQMAPPLTEVRNIQLQLTTHLSTRKGWKAELAWLVDL